MSTDHHAGLEEVKVMPSSITLIEGKSLYYRGIAIEELAEKSNFEEVVYLLWYGRLPGIRELDRLKKELRENNQVPWEIQEMIHHFPRQAHPMAALRTLVSALALHDHEADILTHEANERKAIRILAKIPVLVTGFERHRKAKSIIAPRQDLSFAANFLYMLWGEEPDEISVRTLETALVLYAEHELNASTFNARIVTAALADMYAAITSALATLKGALHGGATQKAMEMLLDIGDPQAVPEWIDIRLARKERIMGFGHRVYKEGDPRVPILKAMAEKLCQKQGYEKAYETALAVEEYMLKKKNLRSNVDFYGGLVFYALGFPTDMFTAVFAVARTAGWIAHIFEQYENNRLIRPRAEYTGPRNIAYRPIQER